MENIELYNDHFQNFKVYHIPKAQLVIADIPYNIGKNAYGSNPKWYKGGGITKTENPNSLARNFSTQIKIFEWPSICTFVRTC